jgi:flagellar hook-associated protein FlgK
MADILSIGASGLSAYRRSLEVTGNNIVNANTDGYARRDVQLQGTGEAASSPTTLRTGSGSGVTVDVIRRATDIFVQSEKRVTQSASSAATALSDRLDRLEKAMFSGDGDLGKLSQTLFSRLQDFATTPSSIAVRTTVIQAANDLATGFNVQANRLDAEANAVVSDAQSQLDDLNALTKQLAVLNKQIESIGGDQGKANDLLDQRDKLVDNIVKIIGVTVESRPSGAVNLYLSDSTAGPQLLGPNGAKTLSASRVNGHLQITLDPYGASVPLSKIQGGTVGGIQSFDDQITSMSGQLDRIAVGFAKRMNDQHAKGTDLDGKKGLAVFSTDTLTVTPAKSNKGISTATIDMGQIGAVEPGDYRATFNTADNKWTIVNLTSGVKASAADRVTIDGMTISFSGKPADGDTYVFSPLTNAASAMRVLIDDPRQLAASLPQLAEAVTGNQSSATIGITSTGGVIDPPPTPSLETLFNQSSVPNNAISFKQSGIVSSIPSGAGPVALYSLGEVSAATLKFDPKLSNTTSDIATLAKIGTAKLRLTINGTTTPDLTLFPNGVTDPATLADPAQALADEINRALAEHQGIADDLGNKLFASTANGYVTINALGSNAVTAATITGTDSLSSASASITVKASAAEIDLVTREGIQLSGATVVPADLVNSTNGFMDGATLPQAPTLSSDSSGTILSRSYRSLQITDVKSPIANQLAISSGMRTSTIKFDIAPEADNPKIIGSASPTLAPGAVYSLSVDGLASPIRLAGKSIIGKTSADIAAMMADRLTQSAPQRAIVGTAVTLPSDLTTASFSITINGVQSTVDFSRSRDAQTGNALPGGTFSVRSISANPSNKGTATASFDKSSAATNGAGPYQAIFSQAENAWKIVNLKTGEYAKGTSSASLDGIKVNFSGTPSDGDTFRIGDDPTISMVPADSTNPTGPQKLILSLPKSLSTTLPPLSISGSDAAQFGLIANGLSEQIISTKPTTSDLATAQSTLNTQFAIPTGSVSLTDDGRVMITRPLSGSLSSLNLTDLSTNTAAHRDAMSEIGFAGSDLTLSVSNKTLSLTSKVAVVDGSTPNLTDTSATVSRVGHKVTIASAQAGGAIPEDLLVSMHQGDQNGPITLASTYDKAITRRNPVMPDIEADVTGDGIVSLYALQTDASGNLLHDTNGAPLRGDLIAQRTYRPGIPVDYMGAQFVIDGNASVGDKFRITTDPSRTGDNRNALALIDIGRSDLLNKGSGTFADIYSAAVSKIGSSTQAAKTSASAAKTVADNVAAAYDSATGVNLDTEAAELIKLQQAYSACAQIVSTARDMFQMILKAF